MYYSVIFVIFVIMIAYSFKLYRTDKTKHLDRMLGEAAWIWNLALSIQKRYYRMTGKYVSTVDMQKHFAKRHKPTRLHSQSVQEILQRQDEAYQRFFKHLSVRPPKFRRAKDFTSIVFKLNGGYRLSDNRFTINKIHKTFKFSKSWDIEGNVKRLTVKRNRLGEYFIVVTTDTESKSYVKSRKGASVGMDFGLKHYLTLSDGGVIDCPLFLKDNLTEYRRLSRNLSKCQRGSSNRERKRKQLDRLFLDIRHKREDFQWKLSHTLCRKYDEIFLEDLNLTGMCRRWGRKMSDLAFGDFVLKLEYIASKYGVVVHKIDRFYPSSKTCSCCGHIYRDLRLSERSWVCPECHSMLDRDLNASINIYRKGVSDLGSDSKTLVGFPLGAVTLATQESCRL